jgi:hypothetical protein
LDVRWRGDVMRNHRAKRQTLRALAAAIAALAFLLALLFDVFDIAHRVNDRLLSASAIFQSSIQVGTLIAVTLSLVLAGGLIWFHIDRFATCWKQTIEWLKTSPSIWRYVLGAFAVTGIFIVALIFLPQPGNTDNPNERKIASREEERPPKTTPPVLEPPPGNQEPSLKPTPQGRMAGRDVCDLFEDFTAQELRACISEIRRNPNRGAIGGPICTKVDGRVVCQPWPVPLPRPRPPLNILPR